MSVAAALVLAGCASGDSSNSEPTSEGAKDAVLEVAADFMVAPGPVFDAVNAAGGQPNTWMALMYGTMLLESPDGPQPGLATEWSFPDSRTVALTLREGVEFQDGTPFNAEAVKTSWDRIIASETMVKTAGIAAMESVEIDGDYGVTVNLSADVAGDWRDILLTSAETLAVASPTALEELGDDFASAPVGAGPYKLDEYSEGQRIVLKAWDGFYDPELQSAGTIEFIQTNPGAATVASLVAGDSSIARASFDDAVSLKSQGLDVEVLHPITNLSSFLAFCTTKGPLQELDARKAIAYALDVDELNERAYNGLSQAATSPLNHTSPYFQETKSPYEHDVDEARSLAKSSGLSGQTLKMLAGPAQVKDVEVLQQQLADAGITMEIEPVANIFQSAFTSQPDMLLISGSRLQGLGSFVTPQGQANWCKNDFPDVAAAWTTTRDTSLTDAELSDAWADLQGAIYDDVPVHFVTEFADPTAFNADHVEGITPSSNLREGALLSWAALTVHE